MAAHTYITYSANQPRISQTLIQLQPDPKGKAPENPNLQFDVELVHPMISYIEHEEC
jgi:hypothetical protein